MTQPLKNLFNKVSVEKFSDLLLTFDPTFEKGRLIKSIFTKEFDSLELKERMNYITIKLHEVLSGNYSKDIKLLIKSTVGEKGFFYMILPHYVEIYGIDDFDESIKALEEFTKLCSSEFAVRPFIIKYENQMLKVMENWSKSKNEDVRRLASEGARPILPWAMDLPSLRNNPSSLRPILENLIDDESIYVRKSVANNLNAISKDNPNFVLEFCKKWSIQKKEIDWVIKHGLRTLLKKGNTDALKLIGYDNKSYIIKKFTLEKEVQKGDSLDFSFEIFSDDTLGKIRVEYILHLLRKRGQYNKKVFKISESEEKKQSKRISKSHSFREITTRKYYEGLHYLTIVVNGIEMETKKFILK